MREPGSAALPLAAQRTRWVEQAAVRHAGGTDKQASRAVTSGCAGREAALEHLSAQPAGHGRLARLRGCHVAAQQRRS